MIRIFLAAIALLLATSAVADGQPVTMWEAKGRINSVYLLGSIHLLRKEDHPLPSVIEAAYQDAEVVVMEIDMDDIDPMATLSLFTSAGLIQDGKTLRQVMGEKAWTRAETAASDIDIPLHMMSGVEPWYAAITVELMALSRIGFDANFGIETYMTNKSVADGKPIEGLETLEEQIGFLDGLSIPAQRDMLISTLESSAEMTETMDEMIAAWRSGDTRTLETEMLDEFAEYEELHQTILVDRNNRWMDRIVALLNDDQDYLVVVGALHLIGRHGVPRQLAARGVDVRQLSEPASLR